MFGRDKVTARIDALVGSTVRVAGDIEFSGGLHVDGRVAGNVIATGEASSTLSVSEHGWIEGSVEAANVVLNGTVKGDIRARERVVLGASARVQGNVYYGVIEMTLGAQISGRLVPLPGRSAAPGATAESEQA